MPNANLFAPQVNTAIRGLGGIGGKSGAPSSQVIAAVARTPAEQAAYEAAQQKKKDDFEALLMGPANLLKQQTAEHKAADQQAAWDKFEYALRETNHRVDIGLIPENQDGYAAAYALYPGGAPKFTPYDSCRIIYGQRQKDKMWTAQGFSETSDLEGWCAWKVSILEPPRETIWGWIETAVSDAGDGIVDAANAISKVPVIGTILGAAWSGVSSPWIVAADIANGERVDRAMLDHFKRELKNVKDVAPYAQMVITFIPGIGPAASAAISIGIALAEGQPITEALIAGVKGALPGGPLVAAAFELTRGIIEGKPIEDIGINILPLDDSIKDDALMTIHIVKAVATGQNVTAQMMQIAERILPSAGQMAADVAKKLGVTEYADTMMTELGKLMPADKRGDMMTAITSAVAMAHGKAVQEAVNAVLKDTNISPSFLADAQSFISSDGATSAAYNLIPVGARRGFETGIGIMRRQNEAGLNVVKEVRDKLNEGEQTAYDAAIAIVLGKKQMQLTLSKINTTKGALDLDAIASQARHLTMLAAPTTLNSAFKQSGFLLATGMVNAPVNSRVAIMNAASAQPDAREGAAQGLDVMADEAWSWWDAILAFFHLGPQKPARLSTT